MQALARSRSATVDNGRSVHAQTEPATSCVTGLIHRRTRPTRTRRERQPCGFAALRGSRPAWLPGRDPPDIVWELIWELRGAAGASVRYPRARDRGKGCKAAAAAWETCRGGRVQTVAEARPLCCFFDRRTSSEAASRRAATAKTPAVFWDRARCGGRGLPARLPTRPLSVSSAARFARTGSPHSIDPGEGTLRSGTTRPSEWSPVGNASCRPCTAMPSSGAEASVARFTTSLWIGFVKRAKLPRRRTSGRLTEIVERAPSTRNADGVSPAGRASCRSRPSDRCRVCRSTRRS